MGFFPMFFIKTQVTPRYWEGKPLSEEEVKLISLIKPEIGSFSSYKKHYKEDNNILTICIIIKDNKVQFECMRDLKLLGVVTYHLDVDECFFGKKDKEDI